MLPIENKGLKTLLLQKFTKQSNNLSANFNNLLFVTAVLSLRLVLSMLFYLFVTSNLNHNTWCQTNSNQLQNKLLMAEMLKKRSDFRFFSSFNSTFFSFGQLLSWHLDNRIVQQNPKPNLFSKVNIFLTTSFSKNNDCHKCHL